MFNASEVINDVVERRKFIGLVDQFHSETDSLYCSGNTFEAMHLKPELLKGLLTNKFFMPSKIQQDALPILLNNPPRNVIAQSQNGTGKTLTYVLTVLSRIEPRNAWPQCVCLVPTYELGLQVGQVMTEIAAFMPDVKIRFALRGEQVERGTQIKEQVVIGTPGRTLDWITKMRVLDLSRVICMVFDEADLMISQQGLGDQSLRFKRELDRCGATYQSMLFSATFDDDVMQFATSIITDPVVITVDRERQILRNVKEYYVTCANRHEKFDAIVNLYAAISIASSIVFCRTRKAAEWLGEQMRSKEHEVAVLHGELDVAQRASVIEDFVIGESKVLITTNLCARGINIPRVAVVINYDPPTMHNAAPQESKFEPDFDIYLHRIGRTGRFGKPGIAMTFVSDPREVQIVRQIGFHFGREIELLDATDMSAMEALGAN